MHKSERLENLKHTLWGWPVSDGPGGDLAVPWGACQTRDHGRIGGFGIALQCCCSSLLPQYHDTVCAYAWPSYVIFLSPSTSFSRPSRACSNISLQRKKEQCLHFLTTDIATVFYDSGFHALLFWGPSAGTWMNLGRAALILILSLRHLMVFDKG